MNKNNIKNISILLIGPLIAAFGLCGFLIPSKIVNGGISGLATVIYYKFHVQPGITCAIINIVLLGLALKVLGMKFTLKTIIGAALFSAYIGIFSGMLVFTENQILATLFGSVLYGIGLGITLASGASVGGTDIVGRLIQSKWANLPIGKLLLVIDGLIIAISYFVFSDIDLILFAILSLVISTYMVDLIIRLLNTSKLAFVITEKGNEIARLLISTSSRGVTIIDAEGAYTNENKKMLVCALKSNEITAFKYKIEELDSNAFVIFCESQQILGNGFKLYR